MTNITHKNNNKIILFVIIGILILVAIIVAVVLYIKFKKKKETTAGSTNGNGSGGSTSNNGSGGSTNGNGSGGSTSNNGSSGSTTGNGSGANIPMGTFRINNLAMNKCIRGYGMQGTKPYPSTVVGAQMDTCDITSSPSPLSIFSDTTKIIYDKSATYDRNTNQIKFTNGGCLAAYNQSDAKAKFNSIAPNITPAVRKDTNI